MATADALWATYHAMGNMVNKIFSRTAAHVA